MKKDVIKSIEDGELQIGSYKINCAVLDDKNSRCFPDKIGFGEKKELWYKQWYAQYIICPAVVGLVVTVVTMIF